MTSASVEEIAHEWLREMQSCCREVDFARARQIISDDVVGFGSRSAVLNGLDALERDQWRYVWPVIRDFTFQIDRLTCGRSGDLIWIACPWMSRGQATDGTWRDRPGRMTVVLRKSGDRWLAVHTHHSLAP